MVARIQFRRDTAANWAAYNPIPLAGEPCYETDTGNFKIGDGHSTYSELPTFVFDMSGYVAKSELSNYVTLTQLQEALANINTGGGGNSSGSEDSGNGNTSSSNLIPLSDIGSISESLHMCFSLWDTMEDLTSDTTIALEDEGYGPPDVLITTEHVSNIAADHIILDVTYISSSGEQKMLSYCSQTTDRNVCNMEVLYDTIDFTSWSQSTVPISGTGLVAIPFTKGSKHIVLRSATDINFKVVGFTDGEPQLS